MSWCVSLAVRLPRKVVLIHSAADFVTDGTPNVG